MKKRCHFCKRGIAAKCIFHFSSFLIVGFLFFGRVCYAIVVTSLALHTAKSGGSYQILRKPEIRSCIRIQFRASACTLERRSLLRSIYVMRRFCKKGKNCENDKTDQRGKLLLNLRFDVYVLFVPDAPHIREITERRLAGPPHGNLTPPSF